MADEEKTLKDFVTSLEGLMSQRSIINEDISIVMGAAGDAGFDKAAIRALIKYRADRDKQGAVDDMYEEYKRIAG